MREESVIDGFRSLVDVTEELCSRIRDEEYDLLAGLLDAREQLLGKQADMIRAWEESFQVPGERQKGIDLISPSLEILKQVDKKFSTLYTQKTEETALKLRQASNSKLLLAYSR